MCSSIAAATKPTPPQSHIPLAQAAKVEKQKKRRSRKHSFDLRRGVLINNAVKAHHQRKQERRKQREAAKVAQALEAISAVKVPPSTVVQCPDTSPFLTPPPSPPPQAALFVNPSYNLATSPSNPFSSNAKTTPTCTHPDPFDIMMELVLKHDDGDVIAKASTNSVIVHACNCLGAWGSGIALQLKQHFPAAYTVYQQHCKAQQNNAAELLGTCLLIPPQAGDYEDDYDDDKAASQSTAKTRSSTSTKDSRKNKKKEPVWIACLFTSVGYGKGNKRTGNPGVSSKEDIAEATNDALLGMLWKWLDMKADPDAQAENERVDDKDDGKRKDGQKKREIDNMPGEIFSPRFNAGSFGVPWEATEELIVQRWSGVEVKWTVVSN